jgi:hypothetical protein
MAATIVVRQGAEVLAVEEGLVSVVGNPAVVLVVSGVDQNEVDLQVVY